MKLIAGVDIGNSTTEVCVGSVGEDGSFHFLASASRFTTGTKGTLPNIHGIKGALEDAMVHPEKYPDLIVRVSGFSAVFVNLRKETQQELLSRTLYDAV